jgi:hypothetical protein
MGEPEVHRARHLFREHCRATLDPMVHFRMAAGNHIVGWSAGECACQQLPQVGRGVATLHGLETSPELFRGFGAGRTALRKAAGHAPDRNKCTPQGVLALRCCADATVPRMTRRLGLRKGNVARRQQVVRGLEADRPAGLGCRFRREAALRLGLASVTKRDRTVATVGRQDAASSALDRYVHRSAVPRLGD